MAVSVGSLRARYDELGPVADAVVASALSEAARRTSATVYGDRYDDALSLRAMHLIALSPRGLNARVEGAKPGSLEMTVYGGELAGLMREAAGGPHMVGVGPLE